MTLFGAIIVVGLGPALWLGAQFGHASLPTAPPVINVESTRGAAPGGAGAGVDEAGLEGANRPVENHVDRLVVPKPTTTTPPLVLPSSSPPQIGTSAIPVDSSAPPSVEPSPSRSTVPTDSTSSNPSSSPTADPVESPDTPDASPITDPSEATDSSAVI